MEAFAPLPVDLFADPSNLLEEDPYFSLSQFDLELQQQAQAALFQQQNWQQDFDKYLPIEQTFTRNVQAQPIFNQQQQFNNAFNDTSLLYEPMQSPPVQQSPVQEQVLPSPPQNAFDKINNQVKQEYASPESLPHSPPTLHQSNDSTPLFNDSPRPSFDFMNWPTMDPTQAKVPIQRLKSNSIITNAVNAAMNNTTTTKHKKTAHNAIERRYRNNINDRITELKNAVPALLYAKVNRTGKRTHDDEDEGEDGQEYLDGVAVATKLNKATILRKATEYINHLKKTGDDVRRENETLQHILAQLPGGSDILQRYKQTRETQLYQEEQEQQQRKKIPANRKRTKYKHSEDEGPPAMANRVFMAVFMSITFFSTSPTSTEQNLHHTTTLRTESYSFTNDTFLGSFFKFDDTWSSLRTIIFIICIGQLMFPYVKYMFFGSSLKLKRVKRVTTTRKDPNDTTTSSPGDLKSRHIYTILNNNTVPEYTLFPFFQELIRFFCHHVVGYDIMYGPEEEYAHVCKWIKLNETRCIGGDLGTTRFSMLFTCLRMINLVDTLDEGATLARAYATAAMMMPLIFPNRYISDKLSDYLWLHVAKHDDDDEEEDAWMQTLDLEYMRDSRAWSETIQVLQNQISLALETRPRSQLCLSYTAPVTAPVSILSTFHLLDTLYEQFNRLVNNMSSTTTTPTEFVDMMLLTPENELVHWLATVGAMVESLWTSQDAEQYIPDLLRVPRAMSSSSSQKQLAHQQDELIKKIMVHTLVGTVLLRKKNQDGGLEELENAQVLRSALRKSKYRYENNLESVVLALAEFVVCLVGLESCVSAMTQSALMDEQVRDVTLHLRRMIRVPFLVNDNQSMVDRLSRLGRFMAHQEDELAIEDGETALSILRG